MWSGVTPKSCGCGVLSFWPESPILRYKTSEPQAVFCRAVPICPPDEVLGLCKAGVFVCLCYQAPAIVVEVQTGLDFFIAVGAYLSVD